MPSACGTIGAYTQHRRRSEDPCRPCKDAWNAYQAEYRRTHVNPVTKEKERLRAAAVSRALHRLRKEYPKRFYELFTEELAK